MIEETEAIRLHAYGGPEAVRRERIPVPECGDDDILVAVAAAGVNPVDWKIREGLRRDRMPLALPVTLGCDIAGQVTACGRAVTAFKPGDRVFAMVGLYGGFARHVVLPAAYAAPVPDATPLVEAASVPLAALTAWQALHLAGIAPGKRVLVHAGGGGVGGFAVQIAKALGAWVAATASPEKTDPVRRLGADQVIDYRTKRFETETGGLNIVFDLIGGETQDRSWPLLIPGGFLVSTIAVPPPQQCPAGMSAARVGVRPDGAALRRIATLMADGRLSTHLQAVFPFERTGDALEESRNGGTRGKIAVVLAP